MVKYDFLLSNRAFLYIVVGKHVYQAVWETQQVNREINYI